MMSVSGGNSPKTSDQTLIALALNGHQSAYTILTRRYERLVYNVALEVTQNLADAEEVAQDTFLKAWRFLHTWRQESKYSTWLYRVARSCAMDFLRRKKRPVSSLEHVGAAHFADETPDMLDKLMRQDTLNWIESAMTQLNEQDRLVLGVFYFGEKSLDEICQITGWSLSNAKSRLCRARRRLKEHLV